MNIFDRRWMYAAIASLVSATTIFAQQSSDGNATHSRYKVSILENMRNGTYTVGIAINNAGEVLGWAFDNAACNPLGCGAVWKNNKPELLGNVDGGLFTRPFAFHDPGSG